MSLGKKSAANAIKPRHAGTQRCEFGVPLFPKQHRNSAGNCTNNPDRWTISGTNPNYPEGYLQPGTLHQYIKNAWVHLGQHERPFQLEVTALKIF